MSAPKALSYEQLIQLAQEAIRDYPLLADMVVRVVTILKQSPRNAVPPGVASHVASCLDTAVESQVESLATLLSLKQSCCADKEGVDSQSPGCGNTPVGTKGKATESK